ncbi:hypothetical protein QFC22_000467 [Naganishia vaughanmartiniae]|uniref:Uncharacterized protein n=1 Tax=Naganishia vaughanmartiniae TaxID=1424756 RepID=A0ACC2XQ59_9TREE|nr:hypothetical protein QFC22_000467 [Naganishia vaughanmartiniae]
MAAPAPRRPDRPGIKLSIPVGNVPGNYTGSSDDGEWNLPQPSLRPSASRSVPIPAPAPLPTRSQLGPALTAPAPFKTGRSNNGKLPALSLNISAVSQTSRDSHDDPDGSAYYGGLHTPLANTVDGGYGRTVGQRTDNTAQEEKTVTHMSVELADALRKMRMTPQPNRNGVQEGAVGQATPQNRSRSSSITSGNHMDLAALVGDATSEHGGELDPNDYETMERLGEGASGTVDKVRDRKTGKIMALKIITTSPNPAVHKQLLRELQFLNECKSPFIVDHYGSFLTSNDSCIGILMEFCEAGSLDSLLQRIKKRRARTSEKVLGRMAESVLGGLDYLHERKIIHRDIKPSNIVVTRKGEIKLCDFGVSGELVNSMAGTFTGTSFYMAPERIQGLPYSIKSDVWSMGLTLHEIAHNRFPFPPEGEPPLQGPIELLNFIVAQPVPKLIDSPAEGVVWSAKAQDFIAQCLVRDPSQRPYPRDLFKHPWIIDSSKRNINLAKWVAALYEW